MERVTENVYAATDIIGCNPGYVVTSDGCVVIDTPQLPTKAVELRERLLEKGPIRFVINTEHHIDHIFGNIYFEGVCPIVGHDHFLKLFGRVSSGEDLYDFTTELVKKNDPEGLVLLPSRETLAVRLPTITFTGRLTLRVGEHVFDIFNTPGHTRGQLAIHVPKERVLFVGDNIFCECQTWFQSADPDSWLRSLEFLETFDVDYIIPGHGPVCDKNYIKKQSAFIRRWVTTVAEGIAQGWSKEECVKKINFLDHYPMDIGLDHLGPRVQKVNVENIFDFLQGKTEKYG